MPGESNNTNTGKKKKAKLAQLSLKETGFMNIISTRFFFLHICNKCLKIDFNFNIFHTVIGGIQHHSTTVLWAIASFVFKLA